MRALGEHESVNCTQIFQRILLTATVLKIMLGTHPTRRSGRSLTVHPLLADLKQAPPYPVLPFSQQTLNPKP